MQDDKVIIKFSQCFSSQSETLCSCCRHIEDVAFLIRILDKITT